MLGERRFLVDGAFGCYACDCHSHAAGMNLSKPLDSGLRRNDDGAGHHFMQAL